MVVKADTPEASKEHEFPELAYVFSGQARWSAASVGGPFDGSSAADKKRAPM